MLANELYGRFYNRNEEELKGEIHILKDGGTLEDCRLLNKLVKEILMPSKVGCIYVPGLQRSIELKQERPEKLQVDMLSRLALLNSVMENEHFGELLEVLNKSVPEDSSKEGFVVKMTRFLTGIENSYEDWKMVMQMYK